MRLRTLGIALALLAFVGCAETAPSASAPESGAASSASKPAISAITLTQEQIDEINKLPDPADREAALAQKVCPVGFDDDPEEGRLGAMGPPVKEVVNGQTVYLCCKGCIKQLQADPEKYLAILKQK
ncbi:MAG: hypothetical protein IRY99_22345 [Isosphaeraceae bacterium]|nr:hypothetical protein [Isosphaeraceae bacterium]